MYLVKSLSWQDFTSPCLDLDCFRLYFVRLASPINVITSRVYIYSWSSFRLCQCFCVTSLVLFRSCSGISWIQVVFFLWIFALCGLWLPTSIKRSVLCLSSVPESPSFGSTSHIPCDNCSLNSFYVVYSAKQTV